MMPLNPEQVRHIREINWQGSAREAVDDLADTIEFLWRTSDIGTPRMRSTSDIENGGCFICPWKGPDRLNGSEAETDAALHAKESGHSSPANEQAVWRNTALTQSAHEEKK